jgi:hypothetical protein
MVKAKKARKRKAADRFPEKPQEQRKHPDQWQRDLNPQHMEGQNYRASRAGQGPEARTAADVKALSAKLAAFNQDELAQIPIVPVGTKLKQGAVYLDLREPAPAPFTASAGMAARETNYYTPKAEVPYEHWNRLLERLSPGAGSDEAPTAQPFTPERAEEEAGVERRRPREQGAQGTEDSKIDQAGVGSFPASDPPSWTTGQEKKTN